MLRQVLLSTPFHNKYVKIRKAAEKQNESNRGSHFTSEVKMSEFFRLRLSDETAGCIPYLELHNVEKFSSFTISSIVDSAAITINRIMLAALSDQTSIFGLFCDDCEDVTVLCEFPLAQLIVLKNFVNQGRLPLPAETIQKTLTFDEKDLFLAFGIDLLSILDGKTTGKFDGNMQSNSIADLPNSLNESLFDSLDYFARNSDYEEEDGGGFFHSNSDDDNQPLTRQKTLKVKRSESPMDTIESDYKHVVGCMKFPDHLPIAPTNCQEKKQKKLEVYKEKYRNYVNFGTVPIVDRDSLLNYELPQPIESYLKFARSEDDEFIPAGKGKFSCTLCKTKCPTDAALRKHKRKYHASKYFCPTCGKHFQRRVWFNFIRHMYQHTITNEAIVHECICCGYQADTISRIDLHRDSHGVFHNNECTQCSEKLRSYKDNRHHVDTHHSGNWTYRCGICPELFTDKKDVSKHINAAHKNKRPKNIICDPCGKAFSNETHLNTHMGSKKCKQYDRPMLKCDCCKFETKFQPYLNKHIRTVHEKLTCTHCGKIVPKSRMNLHMMIFHTENGAKPFQCKECGKGFATKKTFQEHMNIHTGERPYQCDLCEKRFASSGNMYMHRRSSHMGYRRAK